MGIVVNEVERCWSRFRWQRLTTFRFQIGRSRKHSTNTVESLWTRLTISLIDLTSRFLCYGLPWALPPLQCRDFPVVAKENRRREQKNFSINRSASWMILPPRKIMVWNDFHGTCECDYGESRPPRIPRTSESIIWQAKQSGMKSRMEVSAWSGDRKWVCQLTQFMAGHCR